MGVNFRKASFSMFTTARTSPPADRGAAMIVWMAWYYFAIEWWLGALAIPLVFIFVTVGATS